MRTIALPSAALLLLVLVPALAAKVEESPPSSVTAARPTGVNCELEVAPASAGEEINHNYLIRVFPRRSDIGANYTGCQAVFTGAAGEPAKLVWLVSVIQGEPVRTWSPHPELKDMNACTYRSGVLIHGDNECPRPESLLMPSLPSGCVAEGQSTPRCRYDLK